MHVFGQHPRRKKLFWRAGGAGDTPGGLLGNCTLVGIPPQVSEVAMLTLCTHTPPQHFSRAHFSPISTRPAFATEDYVPHKERGKEGTHVMNSCHLLALVSYNLYYSCWSQEGIGMNISVTKIACIVDRYLVGGLGGVESVYYTLLFW